MLSGEDASENASQTGQLAAVGKRLDRLERENRWMKRALVLVLAFVVARSAIGAADNAEPRDLTVSSLTVVDGSKRVVRLSPTKTEAGQIEVFGPDRRVAVTIEGTSGLGEISLYDTAKALKDPQMTLKCVPSRKGGGTQLFMWGTDGRPTLNLLAQKQGNVYLYDKDGSTRLWVGLNNASNPRIDMLDSKGGLLWAAP